MYMPLIFSAEFIACEEVESQDAMNVDLFRVLLLGAIILNQLLKDHH